MKRTIILFTLLAFINTIVGCGMSTKQVRVDELNGAHNKKIWAIILPETIDGVIKSNGDTVSFRNGGGLYQSKDREISGTIGDESTATFSVDNLEQIRLKRGTLQGYETRSLKPMDFLINSRKKTWHTLHGVSIREGMSIEFTKPGATFDSTEHFIRGVAVDGSLVEIETKKVYRAVYRRFSPDKLAGNALLIGVGCVVLVGLFVLFADPLGDWRSSKY